MLHVQNHEHTFLSGVKKRSKTSRIILKMGHKSRLILTIFCENGVKKGPLPLINDPDLFLDLNWPYPLGRARYFWKPRSCGLSFAEKGPKWRFRPPIPTCGLGSAFLKPGNLRGKTLCFWSNPKSTCGLGSGRWKNHQKTTFLEQNPKIHSRSKLFLATSKRGG